MIVNVFVTLALLFAASVPLTVTRILTLPLASA
jgi:hypothetical protein